jgi:hypothetical protein
MLCQLSYRAHKERDLGSNQEPSVLKITLSLRPAYMKFLAPDEFRRGIIRKITQWLRPDDEHCSVLSSVCQVDVAKSSAIISMLPH